VNFRHRAIIKTVSESCLAFSRLDRACRGSALSAPVVALAQGQEARPQPVQLSTPLPQPRDIAYPGQLTIDVDARDTSRGIFRVKQTIPVAQAGRMTLLYPNGCPATTRRAGRSRPLRRCASPPTDGRCSGNATPPTSTLSTSTFRRACVNSTSASITCRRPKAARAASS
jgi:hypothetical protein